MIRRALCLLLLPALAAARPQNIAHRGGARAGPESTLAACRAALAAGADVLELDLHATADGVVVVCHDATVDRTTDGRGRIAAMRLAELRRLDAGYRFTRDGRSFPHRGQGLRIPTLDELLSAFPATPLVLEFKQLRPPIVEPVLALLRRHDALGRVVLASRSSSTLEAVRRAAPGVRTGFGAREVLDFVLLGPSRERGYAPPGQVLQVPSSLLTPRFVARARRFGLQLQAWTANDRRTMERLVARGVDGIMTDDPARLRRVLERH